MAYITGSVIDSFGVLPFSLSAGTQLSMSIQNSLPGVSYYGLETVPDGNGFYNPTTPRNLSGSFILGSGIVDVVYDDYKMVAAVAPGGGTLTYTPAVAIMADTLRTKGTGASLGPVDFGTLLASSYSKRVTAAGGYVESPDSITAAIAATPILQDASFLYVPSGYASGTAFSELSTKDYVDLTWTRATDAWRTNADELIQRVPWNLLQQSETFDNEIWVKTSTTIVANAEIAPNATMTADIMTVTSSATNLSQTVSYPIYGGGEYTFSVYVKVISTTTSGAMRLQGVVDGANVSMNFTPTTEWQLFTQTINATTSITSLRIRGLAFVGTVAIWGAQLTEGTTAQPYLPTTTRLNVPRLDYTYGTSPASLLEPERTNQIPNSICSGSITGTPGTYPAHWSATSTGLTQSVVAIGTENGLAYVDLRFNGTANTTLARITFEGPTVIPVTNNYPRVVSTYAKLISGSYDSSALGFIMRSIDGSDLGLLSQTITLNSTFQRFSYSATTNVPLTNYAQPCIDFYVTSGQTYDFTIRIAQPQFESGAYSTTPILTDGSFFVTRIADSFSRNNIYTNGLITSSGGTWFVKLLNNVAYVGDLGNDAILLGDTNNLTGNNFRLLHGESSGRMRIFKTISGSLTSLYTTTTDTTKIAIKWNGSTADIFANGTKVVSATAFTATALEFFRTNITAAPKFISQMALFPTPLTDAECIALTTL